jgi:hypothetical protein
MIKVNPKKREMQDTIWTVIETFGFIEVENNEINTAIDSIIKELGL